MRLIQFETSTQQRRVGLVQDQQVLEISNATSMRHLAMQAITAGKSLMAHIHAQGTGNTHDYAELLHTGRVLPPLDHEDPAHCLVSGTGLTHLGSASTRDKMHQKPDQGQAQPVKTPPLTDSMRMFQLGVEKGRPPAGQAGAQPEWFYKGDGSIVVRPGASLPVPDFAEDAGEEPELVGLYVIGPDARPYRLGYALGNEFSDHIMERRNYLYLAHSKLRFCSYGPELRPGPLPPHLEGYSRILREGRVLWEKPFLSGEDNMCHSLENLEYHHFKYTQFLRPGDVHIHYLGTATLSFADGIQTRPGDIFEIGMSEFGAPLQNPIATARDNPRPGLVQAL